MYDDDGGAAVEGGGFRVLVDRLWPRGITKERAAVDLWLKDVAPSTELRKAFHHEAALFDDFVRRYNEELESNPAVDELREVFRHHGNVVPCSIRQGPRTEPGRRTAGVPAGAPGVTAGGKTLVEA